MRKMILFCHHPLFWLFFITVLGLILRLYRLNFQSFWEDELYSWWASHFPDLRSMLVYGVLPDIHPPGYQLINYLAQQLGAEAEFGLRLPSVMAGTLAIPAIFFLGRRLYGDAEGLIAALLMAVLHFPLYYSQEARAYALLLLFTLITTYLWLEILGRWSTAAPDPPGLSDLWLWVTYIVTAVFTAYLHYAGLLLFILQGITTLGVLLFVVRRRLTAGLVLYTIIALAYLPWLPGIAYQFRNSPRGEWITQSGSLLENFLLLMNQFFNQRWPQTYLVLGFMAFALAAQASKGWRRSSSFTRNERPFASTLFLVLWLVVPFLLFYLVSEMFRPVFTYRNLIIVFPAAVLLLARGLTQLPGRIGGLVGTFLLAGIFLVQLVGGDYYTNPHKTQFREAAAYIVNQEATPDKAIIIGQFAYPFLLDYYFDRHHLPQRVDLVVENKRICSGEKYRFESFPGVFPCPTVSGNFRPQVEEDPLGKLADFVQAQQPERIWYVHGRYDLLIDPDTTFGPAYRFVSRDEMAGIHVYLFTRR